MVGGTGVQKQPACCWVKTLNATSVRPQTFRKFQQCRAASSTGAVAKPSDIARQILSRTEGTNISTVPDDVKQLVDSLVSAQQTYDGAKTISSGSGVWKVIYAPHIRTLAGVLQGTIEPVQYSLKGDVMTTNVKLSNPLGTFWLSARAKVRSEGGKVALKFDKYWADSGKDALRKDAPEKDTIWDTIINIIAQPLFFVDNTQYPLEYADNKLVIIKFQLLNTLIAAKRA